MHFLIKWENEKRKSDKVTDAMTKAETLKFAAFPNEKFSFEFQTNWPKKSLILGSGRLIWKNRK